MARATNGEKAPGNLSSRPEASPERNALRFSEAVVAGVIGVAVAFEEAIAHPEDPLTQGAALALTVGVALYVGGLGAASARAGIREGVILRFVVALGALALTPFIPDVAGWIALWALAVAVIAMDLIEGRTREI